MASATTIPHDLDAERSLLSCFGWRPQETATKVADVVRPGDFYKPAHGLIFEAIQELVADDIKPDLPTVAGHLRDTGRLKEIGGEPGLAEATMRFEAHSTNARRYAETVANLARLRELGLLTGELAEGVALGDLGATLAHAKASIDDIVKRTSFGSALRKPDEVINDYLDDIEARSDGHTDSVPTGLADLDGRTGEPRPGEVWIVGARPNVGKTALGCQYALNAGMAGTPVLFVSQEMTETELMDRFITNISGVPLTRLRSTKKGAISQEDHRRIQLATDTWSKLGISIHDRPGTSVAEITSMARLSGAKLVIIDYLQLMEDDRGRRHENRQVEVAGISRGLKIMARELNVVVWALAQLNRTSADGRPRKEDLRESGQIEADASTVVLLHRDDDQAESGPLEMIIDKARNARKGDVRAFFDGTRQRIRGLTPYDLNPPPGPSRSPLLDRGPRYEP